MAVISKSVAAATAVAGYDLLQDDNLNRVPYNRQVVGVGLKGSTAAGDTLVEIMAGQRTLATLYNSGTDFPSGRNDIIDTTDWVSANEQLHAYVRVKPTTNPINLVVVTQ